MGMVENRTAAACKNLPSNNSTESTDRAANEAVVQQLIKPINEWKQHQLIHSSTDCQTCTQQVLQ